MGKLIYAGTVHEFDDRLLAHLKVVITNKLRMGHSFLLNWSVSPHEGSGHVSLWLDPCIPIAFDFRVSHAVALNTEWLEALERTSHGIQGLTVMSEDDAQSHR